MHGYRACAIMIILFSKINWSKWPSFGEAHPWLQKQMGPHLGHWIVVTSEVSMQGSLVFFSCLKGNRPWQAGRLVCNLGNSRFIFFNLYISFSVWPHVELEFGHMWNSNYHSTA